MYLTQPVVIKFLNITSPTTNYSLIMANITASKQGREWSRLIQEKKTQRDSRIPKEWRLLNIITIRANRNSEASAFELFNESSILTEKERFRFSHVSGAHSGICKRAAIAHQLINPIAEILFEKATDRARECDAFLVLNGRPMGRFHGLRISLKDTFMIKGEPATMGLVTYLAKPVAEHNSAIVDILFDEGAIFYRKTTVSQACLGFGYTLNPQRLSLTAGGSSSGEGALVGFRGSPLGIGTDFGESIRCPAFLNGSYGFRPTSGRLPVGGQQHHFREGWTGVVPVAGPLAKSARDLTMLCRNVIQAGGWARDYTVSYKPWRDLPKKHKLKIGVWTGLEGTPLHPTIARTLSTAGAVLREAGHDVVPVAIPGLSSRTAVFEAFFTSLSLDTDHTMLGLVAAGAEELLPALQVTKDTIMGLPAATLDSVWTVNAQRGHIAAAWHDTLSKLDVMLCPAHHSSRARHGMYGLLANTMIWNLPDCPTKVIPFLKGDDSIDKIGNEFESFHGIFSHLQLVGWTGQDEEVLMATEVVSDILSGHK
ncbi:Acetamidase [Paramyrothecium foliicola]|nr:Acetamidase [Paramyrothecium foliicola]